MGRRIHLPLYSDQRLQVIPTSDLAGALQIAADAGAKRILLPVADMMQYSKVPADLVSKFSLEIYSDPVDAAFKALGIK